MQNNIFQYLVIDGRRGRVDPLDRSSEPLLRTGLAELPHPAPDSTTDISSSSVSHEHRCRFEAGWIS